MTTVCGSATSGELRLNYNGVEAVYKIAVHRIDVNHKLLEVTRRDSYFREYVNAGCSEINLQGTLLHGPAPMSEKDWADVAGITQAAGTVEPNRAGNVYQWPHFGFDARRHKDAYGAYYTAESFASAIANAFYDGEEQRAAYAARVDECASDYSW